MTDEKSEESRFFTNSQFLFQHHFEIITKYKSQGYDLGDPSIIQAGKLLAYGMKPTDLINSFIKNSKDHWDDIKDEKIDFLINHSQDMFKDFPIPDITSLKIIFSLKKRDGSALLDEDELGFFWDSFKSFVKQSIKYIHKRREPAYTKNGLTTTMTYTKSFFDDVNLDALTKTWNMGLF